PDDGARPQLSYTILSKLAIYASQDKRLTISGIYSALIQRFKWFQANTADNAGRAWKVVFFVNHTFMWR
ncbi:hypothetical protein B0H11DRAFT_1727353, partial [Mycena galericulata]